MPRPEFSSKREMAIEAKLRAARIAHLATAGKDGQPHVVPICFVYDGRALYTALDLKPKRTLALTRVRNIQENPRVAVLIDEYSEDWTQLWYVLVHGIAVLLSKPEDHGRQEALRLLQDKYQPYREGLLPESASVIRIRPDRITAWGMLTADDGRS